MSYQGAIETVADFEDLMFKAACRGFRTFSSTDYSESRAILVLLDNSGIEGKSSKFEILTFVLDREFKIDSASSQLDFHPLSILKLPFCELIAPESKPLWSELEKKIVNSKGYLGTFQITFVLQQKILHPSLCSVTRLGNSGRAVVNAVLVSDDNFIQGEQEMPKKAITHEMVRLEKLYHYILENLEHPLPSTYQLAKLFGTNDHTLKEGFRKTFGTSIYQFYNTEKLKRAHLYIEQSTIPLHKIANDLGFGTYGNFTKAFRKKYGYAPSDVKRWDDHSGQRF